MEKSNLSRRGFLTRALGGLVAAGLPVWYAREVLAQQPGQAPRRIGPSDRIVMAAIGTGSDRFKHADLRPTRGERGVYIMNEAMRQSGVQMMATCDVDRVNAEFAAQLVRNAPQGGSRDCQVLTDFRRLLENRNLDAVTIGTPDHWHALIAVAAMKAGKDVYCEKPLTLTLNEGKILVRVAQRTGRILQTGSQQRSDARFRLACELIRNGRLGPVRRVTTIIRGNPTGGPFSREQVPEELDYDFWLGRTPEVPFCKQRTHYDFRWWYDYSGGKLTDWGAHFNDTVQCALGMDESGPVSVSGRGTAPVTDPMSFNTHPTFAIHYTYATGAQLICRNDLPDGFPVRSAPVPAIDNGILFEGDDGKWLFVNRNLMTASDGDHATSRLITEPLPAGAQRLAVSTNHMGNFIDCVRARQQPIAAVDIGHRSASVCHLGNIALRFFPGQTLHWSPQDQQFTGANADEANRHLDRPYRDPWRLEA